MGGAEKGRVATYRLRRGFRVRAADGAGETSEPLGRESLACRIFEERNFRGTEGRGVSERTRKDARAARGRRRAVDRRRGEGITRRVWDVPFPETPAGRNERFARALVAPFVAGPAVGGKRKGRRGAMSDVVFGNARAPAFARVGACETERDAAPRDHASYGLARDIWTRSESVAYLPARLDPTLRVADWADRRDSHEREPEAQSARRCSKRRLVEPR